MEDRRTFIPITRTIPALAEPIHQMERSVETARTLRHPPKVRRHSVRRHNIRSICPLAINSLTPKMHSLKKNAGPMKRSLAFFDFLGVFSGLLLVFAFANTGFAQASDADRPQAMQAQLRSG